MSAFTDILATVFERSARLVDFKPKEAGHALEELTSALMSSRGEASGIALAGQLLERFRTIDDAGRLAYFRHLAECYDPNADEVRARAADYAADPSAENLRSLVVATEPPRQALFRRLNQAPGGTSHIVAMRADLRRMIRDEPDLARVDDDLSHLLSSWFNRGFLVLHPIDWNTPAAILEKIIAYEAVHEIDSWEELRRRVDPPDRRCFAFFHPAMPEEPLIFVEVALTNEVPGSIQKVLDPERERLDPRSATTAVFYSISNCQPGLAGISFGAFLIKQVASDLAADLPQIETFVTLSPAPGLMNWVRAEAEADPDSAAAEVVAILSEDGWHEDEARADETKAKLLGLAARYFLTAKRRDGQPSDPVARFHLGNGAELHAIHWLGDVSPRGLSQSGGIMVNYHYRLDRIEANHEAYATEGSVAATRAVKALAKG